MGLANLRSLVINYKQEKKWNRKYKYLYPMVADGAYFFCNKQTHSHQQTIINFATPSHCTLTHAKDTPSAVEILENNINYNYNNYLYIESSCEFKSNYIKQIHGETCKVGLVHAALQPPTEFLESCDQNKGGIKFVQENRYGVLAFQWNDQSNLVDKHKEYVHFWRGTKVYHREHSMQIYRVPRSYFKGLKPRLRLRNDSTETWGPWLSPLDTSARKFRLKYGDPSCERWTQLEIVGVGDLRIPLHELQIKFHEKHRCISTRELCFDCEYHNHGVKLIIIRRGTPDAAASADKKLQEEKTDDIHVVTGRPVKHDFAREVFALTCSLEVRKKLQWIQEMYKKLFSEDDFHAISILWNKFPNAYNLKPSETVN